MQCHRKKVVICISRTDSSLSEYTIGRRRPISGESGYDHTVETSDSIKSRQIHMSR